MGVDHTVKLKLVTDPSRYWKCLQAREDNMAAFRKMKRPEYTTPEIEVYLPGEKSIEGYRCDSKLFFNVVPWDPNNPKQSRDFWVCMHVVEWPPLGDVMRVAAAGKLIDTVQTVQPAQEINLNVQRMIILDDDKDE